MATIKSYTDIEQSRKLAEILPLESADMYYWCADHYPKEDWIIEVGEPDNNYECIPCWSLAALFDVLPKFIGDYGKYLHYDVDGYCCGYMDDGNFMLIIQETNADNSIDACYEMILKLQERELL